jgi:hypothetical protein
MLSSSFRPLALAVRGLLLCVGVFLLGACGGAGSKRASLYQQLTGTWTIERLDGSINYTSQLEEQYPQGVTVTFRGGDNGRTYRIATPHSEDSTAVLAEGIVILRGDDRLQMASGFGQFGPVGWTYGFEASRAVFSLQFGSRAFLRALFSGGSQDANLEMTLAPDDG